MCRYRSGRTSAGPKSEGLNRTRHHTEKDELQDFCSEVVKGKPKKTESKSLFSTPTRIKKTKEIPDSPFDEHFSPLALDEYVCSRLETSKKIPTQSTEPTARKWCSREKKMWLQCNDELQRGELKTAKLVPKPKKRKKVDENST
jgi:hypothetical protein